MRKITRLAIDAFMSDTPFKLNNTEVVVDTHLTDLVLHGNIIATKFIGSRNLFITNAGFQTNVTKERLNGIPGVNTSQKNFQWFLNGIPWDGGTVGINV